MAMGLVNMAGIGGVAEFVFGFVVALGVVFLCNRFLAR